MVSPTAPPTPTLSPARTPTRIPTPRLARKPNSAADGRACAVANACCEAAGGPASRRSVVRRILHQPRSERNAGAGPLRCRNRLRLGPGLARSRLPADHFSARGRATVSLPAGLWRFHATTDDGVRVYVDGLPIIDQWHTTASVTYNTSATLSGGNHSLRVECSMTTRGRRAFTCGGSRMMVRRPIPRTRAPGGAITSAIPISPARLPSGAMIRPFTLTGVRADREAASGATISRCAGPARTSFTGGRYLFKVNSDDGVCRGSTGSRSSTSCTISLGR